MAWLFVNLIPLFAELAAVPDGTLFKIIFRYNFLPVLCYISEVFVKADSQERTRNIIYVPIPAAQKSHNCVVASLPRTAVYIHRTVLGNFICSLPQLA